jgi:Flp pilus assembly protein TadB
MSPLQLLMLAGMLAMAGIAGLIWWASPAEPDLADALRRISPHQPTAPATPLVSGDDTERAGVWAIRHVPASWVQVPVRDLAVLRKSVASFYGDKLAFAAAAALGIPLLSWLISWTVPLPITIPVIVTLVAMVAGWFLPDLNVRQDAAKARAEFSRALGSYTDLVALERHGGGSGTRQAMELAADVGDSWPFRRVSEELARSRFSGLQPWDALHQLADQLAVTDLDDLADIMRLCGEQGAPVYDTLRARSAATRNALLTHDLSEANETGERMFIPASVTAVIFLAILIVPALLRLLTA